MEYNTQNEIALWEQEQSRSDGRAKMVESAVEDFRPLYKPYILFRSRTIIVNLHNIRTALYCIAAGRNVNRSISQASGARATRQQMAFSSSLFLCHDYNHFATTRAYGTLMPDPDEDQDTYDPTGFEDHLRRREWNRGPLQDLFPRIPADALERVLDLCINKSFTYNLSESKRFNARRYTSIVVAHVRHAYSEYDKLLREDKVERYDARQRTSAQVWKVLRVWCPWNDSNDLLEPCFKATLLKPEERDPGWDPMDIDADSDVDCADDPMDLD